MPLPAAGKSPPCSRKDGSAAGPTCPAFRSPLAVCLFLLLAAAGLAADLLSKHYVFQSMLSDPRLLEQARVRASSVPPGTEPAARDVMDVFSRRICPGVRFSLSTNPGVVFGLPMPRWLVAVMTVGAIVVVGAFFASTDRCARWAHAALALILAGALGNLYDRIFSEVRVPGFAPIRCQVRDFIDCAELYWIWRFNVADALLVVGVGILVVQRVVPALLRRRAEAKTKGAG